MKANGIRQRFTLQEYRNLSGSSSWRVSGIKRTGERIRENHADRQAAHCRQIELEGEFHSRRPEDATLRATKLSDTQLRIAEAVFPKLDLDDDLITAVHQWLKRGKQKLASESPRLDDAVSLFNHWLDHGAKLREASRKCLRHRIGIFQNATGNLRVADIGPDVIETFLDYRNVAAATKHADKRALSRFFSWCVERPRRWITANPCREIRIERPERAPPAILTVEQCERLLRAAESHEDGLLVAYVALCLFAGLRPAEASRLGWEQINLVDREIRLDARQTKTGRARTIVFNDGPKEQAPFNRSLAEWLSHCKDRPITPSAFEKHFAAVRELAGITDWPSDVLRHTAISHYFRKTGSYGRAAEMFGNSESIIKAHYQSRTTSEDTSRFYAIRPAKGASK